MSIGGGIAYSVGRMPFEQLEKIIIAQDSTKVCMKKTTVINLAALQEFLDARMAWNEDVNCCVTFLDALLRSTPATVFSTTVGSNSFFDNSIIANVHDIGAGVQLWKGVFQSARPGPGYMTLNVDVAHTAFYTPGMTVIDLLVANLNLRDEQDITRLERDPMRRASANRLVKGLGVYTSHTHRRDGKGRPEK